MHDNDLRDRLLGIGGSRGAAQADHQREEQAGDAD